MMMTHSRYVQSGFINSIEKEKIYHGQWWPADKPESRVAGVLYLKKSGGIRLYLIGMFESDASNDLSFEFADHPIILGELLPGESPITLIGCKEIERKSPYIQNVSKAATQKFAMDGALFGVHLKQQKDLAFNKLEFSTTYLMNWVDGNKFNHDLKSGQSIISELPNSALEIKGAGYSIKISTLGDISLLKPHSTSQYSSIEIEVIEPLSIEECKKQYLLPLNDFVQFGTSLLNSVNFIEITPSGYNRAHKLYIPNDFDRIEHKLEAFQENVFFRLSEFTTDYQSLIENWLTLYAANTNVFKLYFDSIYIGFQFQVTKFLNLAQALESYHSIRENNTGVILKIRLQTLFEEARSVVHELVGNADEFLNDIRDTRNYYTHYDQSKKYKAATDYKLEALIHISRLLLSYHFLRRCHLDDERTSSIIKRGTYWSSIKSLVRENNFWISNKNEVLKEV